MKHILLLGAGFSRNWGGWLAVEVFEYLLGSPYIINTPGLKGVLWRYKERGGFEAALETVQIEYRNHPKKAEHLLTNFQRALFELFTEMDKGFVDGPRMGIECQRFLAKFDTIFTLNQDVFLERQFYLCQDISLISQNKWSGFQIPGVRPLVISQSQQGKIAEFPIQNALPDDQLKIEDKCQLFFKLHGSFNWRDAKGGELMVMGANKEGSIKSHPALNLIHEQFTEHLAQPKTRLMIIGYSFRDDYINQLILEACTSNNLKVFIIDPDGVDVIKNNNPSRGGTIIALTELEKTMERALIGASRRGLREIFPGDTVEFRKVMRFFEKK